MKIIELLNKIANNEDVPNKIKYRNCIFEKTEGAGISPDYVNNDNEFFLEYISNEADSLNEIVEIIEDEEEIDIQSIEHEDVEIVQEILGKCDLWKGNEEYILKVIKENNNRMVDAVLKLAKENRTIIQAVKQLDKKVNSIEQK